MLHLENFFEKSFALLLTTPRILVKSKKDLQPRYGCFMCDFEAKMNINVPNDEHIKREGKSEK